MRLRRLALVSLALLAACGDRCEQLCQSVGAELATCKPDSLQWSDLGARSRADFVNTCQTEWGRARIDMSASDLRLALEACGDADQELAQLDCADVLALYAPSE